MIEKKSKIKPFSSKNIFLYLVGAGRGTGWDGDRGVGDAIGI